MPAVRLSRRRKSSHGIFSPAKPGVYGVSARPVTFAPNVTPGTFTEPEPADDPLAALALSAADPAAGPHVKALFLNQDAPPAASTRKRCPPGKRFSQGYIPRPPNAFMLFRADFVRQKRVPGNIEANHSSLSKIIGNYWRQLPPDEKRVWEVKSKQEKAAHKIRFPDYRFRPVHNKSKLLKADSTSKEDAASKSKAVVTAEDERRCEEVAQLLLEGKKGEELAKAVQSLDRARSRERELEFEMDVGFGLEDEFDGRSSAADGSLQPSRAASPQTMVPTLYMPTAVHSHTFGFAPHQSSVGADFTFQRRSSSVPLPNEWFSNPFMGPAAVAGGIALPSIPFISHPASPVAPISRLNQAQSQMSFSNFFNTSESQLFSSAEAPHNYTQGLFHPHPQPFPTNSRNSFGLGLRRASSAQPLLWRSWTMPLPNFETFTMGMGMDLTQLERDPSPLPEVDPGLFGDFSFPSGPSQQHEQAPRDHSAAPTMTMPPILAPIDTSIPPQMQHEHEFSSILSASTTSVTTPSSSISPSPVSSVLNLESEFLNNGFGGMHLDSLYASDTSTNAMGMGMGAGVGVGVYTPEDVDSVYGMQMGMYPYEPVVVSPRESHHEDAMLSPKPAQTPTQAEFDQHRQEEAGAAAGGSPGY